MEQLIVLRPNRSRYSQQGGTKIARTNRANQRYHTDICRLRPPFQDEGLTLPPYEITLMLDRIPDILQRFEISHYGFLPVDEPLAQLSNPYYEPWERTIRHLSQLIRDGAFHAEVEALPMLTTKYLVTTPEWRRAYVILSFLTHANIWSGSTPREVLSVNIARPLLEVSQYLGLPPTATYPALNLWNCGLIADGADITNPENVVMRHTFTGTPDEAWFYAVSVSVEAKGVGAIRLMLECIDAVNDGNEERVLYCLKAFSQTILELGRILQRMHERCDPFTFYNKIRPFLAGSRGMEKAGLPHGIFYEEEDGKGSWRQYSGGSNAQSTLIQFLDISLGVNHRAPGERATSAGRSMPIYLDEMRKYMPRSHREFLAHFSTIANVREYALSETASGNVHTAFKEAVDALTAFRDTHIQIVARYIIAPSRNPRGKRQEEVKNIASASSDQALEGQDLKGTGGTNLMTFLKQTRDETKAAKLGQMP